MSLGKLELWHIGELGESCSKMDRCEEASYRWVRSLRAHCMPGNVPDKSVMLITVLCTDEEAGLGRSSGSLMVMAERVGPGLDA